MVDRELLDSVRFLLLPQFSTWLRWGQPCPDLLFKRWLVTSPFPLKPSCQRLSIIFVHRHCNSSSELLCYCQWLFSPKVYISILLKLNPRQHMVPFTGSGEELESTMLSLGLGKVRVIKSIHALSSSIYFSRSCIDEFSAIYYDCFIKSSWWI